MMYVYFINIFMKVFFKIKFIYMVFTFLNSKLKSYSILLMFEPRLTEEVRG
jgi:hypothetical protein